MTMYSLTFERASTPSVSLRRVWMIFVLGYVIVTKEALSKYQQK